MATRSQRRWKYERRRAHALRLDRRGVLHGQVGFYNNKFDPALLPKLDQQAEDIIAFAERYMLSAHRMQDWQKRVIKDVVRSL